MESALLIGEGQRAFADQEYGLAAQRFHQAAVADRKSAKARFLLGQALFALGKYREAVAAIHEGMDLDLNWPRNAFRPRIDLYKGIEADFTAHLKDLEDALAGSPDNRFLLFLDAYQLWLDGRPMEAVVLFRRARAVTVDTSYIDRFLRAAMEGKVAAR
jgi:thioredoxin-like negative regulator of GroEL